MDRAGCFRTAAPAPELYDWADVVCAPVLIDGFSPAVAQALGRRLPVVATEAAGIDAQTPGTLAVSEGSHYELARILEALRHPLARGRLAADLAGLSESRSPARVQAALAAAVLG